MRAHSVQPMGVKCQCTHEVSDVSDVIYAWKYEFPCLVHGESSEPGEGETTFHFEKL
jgi:hypothetical protein